MKQEIRYVVLRVTPEFFKKLKITCAVNDQGVQEYILEAIEKRMKSTK
jgi:hypothetical protein